MRNSTFDFLKRHKLQAEPEQILSIRERAIRVFSRIEELDDFSVSRGFIASLTSSLVCGAALFILPARK